MKYLPKILITCLAIAAIITAWRSIADADFYPTRAIAEARCSAGAFMTHSAVIANDGDGVLDNEAATGVIVSPGASPKLLGPNLIPNGTLETLNFGYPDQWLTNTTGAISASFSVVAGHNSGVATRTEVTSYSNGSADVYYLPVEAIGGAYYSYQDYYRSNMSTRPKLELRYPDGSSKFINLTKAPASSTWARYNTTFFVPTGVKEILVNHPLTALGWLETDDYSMSVAQASGFDTARVSITFDDGWKSIHTNALPLLKRFNFVSTQYLISGYLGQEKAYMSTSDIYDFRSQGSEIASHTVDHLDLTKLSTPKLDFQLTRSEADLRKCFGPITDFAAPYGTYNNATQVAIAKSYQTARSTDVGFNSADELSAYHLKVQNVDKTTTTAQLNDWLSIAKANKLWLILVYHQVDVTASPYSRSINDFEADLKSIAASGIKVETVKQAYQSIRR